MTNAQQTSDRPKAQIRKLFHRGEAHIRVDIDNREYTKNLVRQIRGRKWSQTHGCWYIPYEKTAYQQLQERFEVINLEPKSVVEQPNTFKKSPTFYEIAIFNEHESRVKVYVPWERHDWIHFIKSLPDRAWNTIEKYWSLPKTEAVLQQLEKEFGENLRIEEGILWTKRADKEGSVAFGQVLQMHVTTPPEVEILEFRTGNYRSDIVRCKKVIICPINAEWVAAFVPGDKKGWVEVIKNIPGRGWNVHSRCWCLPYVKTSFWLLKEHVGMEWLTIKFNLNPNIPDTYRYAAPKVKAVASKPPKKKRRKVDLLSPVFQEEVNQLRQILILERLSKDTLKSYTSNLINFFFYYKNENPNELKKEQLYQYLLHRIKFDKISESYQNQIINSIKAWWRRVKNWPELNLDVIRPKKAKQQPNVLSVQEVVALIDVTENLKHKFVLVLLYSAGLRLGEIVNLRKRDINLNRRTIFVHQAKGKKDRIVTLAEQAAVYFKVYVEQYRPKYWLFEGADGGQYSKRSVQRVFSEAVKKSKIYAYATVHTLRHSYATHCIEDGFDIKLVQEALGHHSIKTTEKYLHISNETLKKLKSPLDKLKIK